MPKENKNDKVEKKDKRESDKEKGGKAEGSGNPKDSRSNGSNDRAKPKPKTGNNKRHSYKPKKNGSDGGKGDKGKEGKEGEYSGSKCPGNDFAWYNKNPQLLTSAGSIIFSKRYGDLYTSYRYTGTSKMTVESGNRSVGGVIRARFTEFISAQGSDADPINIAAKNLYTWLRHKNSGAKVYQQSDLIQVLLSSGSVKVAIEFAKKIIRCVASYSPVNRFTMRGVVPYNAAEFTNITQNLANYTARLNLIIAKATSIVIPKDIPVFARWKWLAANVWRDDELSKCSYYSFDPENLWHYDWVNHKCTMVSIVKPTFKDLLDAIELEIDNLLSYDDYGTISGDILKAYDESGLDVTTGMNLGEVLEAAHDPDAIRQFKNMVVTGNQIGTYELDQNPNNLQLLYTKCSDNNLQTALPGKFVFQTSTYEQVPDAGFIYLPKLCVTSDQPSVEECVEQTRLTAVIKTAQTGYPAPIAYLDYVGTEIITDCRVYYYTDQSYLNMIASPNLETLNFIDGTDPNECYSFMNSRVVDIGVKGDPQFIGVYMDGNDLYVTQYFHGDNICVLDEQYIQTLHAACVLSEWTMPMFNFLEVK